MSDREILFRGKRKDNGEWVEGFYINIAFVNPFISTGKIHLTADVISPEMYKVVSETVGQYTGLTDKNGTKIFEGDIVKDLEAQMLGTVVYVTAEDDFEGIAGFMVNDIYDGFQNYNGFWNSVEIIGNIHDNPELLEGE